MTTTKTKRTCAKFFLVIFIYNIIFPSISYALTGGPTAPQTSSFEEVNAPDVVNLLTGNMTYNLALLDVPSPQGGFPLNIFYHAGIKTNQDASNYGLGWGLNTGSINRTTNGYPDDYRTELNSYSSFDEQYPTTLNGEYNDGFTKVGSVYGVPLGNTGAALSLGLSKDQNSGKYGINYLGLGYASGGQSVGMGAGEYGNSFSIGAGGQSVAVPFGSGSGINPRSLPTSTSTNGVTTTSKYSNGWSSTSSVESLGGLYTKINQRVFLDKKTYVEPYGALYLGHYGAVGNHYPYSAAYNSPFSAFTSATTKPTETRAEMDMVQDVNLWSNASDASLQHIAIDDYQVNAPGISGQIKPEIHENGSLVGVTEDFNGYANKNPFSKLPIITSNDVFQKLNTNVKETNFEFRYTDEIASNLEMESGSLNIPGDDNTPTSGDPTVAPTVTSANPNLFTPVPDNPTLGYINKRLKGKRFVEWFTDYGIKKSLGVAPNSYADGSSPVSDNQCVIMNAVQYLNSGPSSFNYSVNNAFVGTFDAVKIKAFKITAEDGTVYHFGLAAYTMNEAELDMPARWASADNTNPNNSNIIRERNSPYAYTWLLTGITGVDFKDVNQDGITNAGDQGYWVRFDYGRWTDSYEWKAPYTNGSYDLDVTYATKMDQHGQKQLFYLNQVATSTHTAIFIHSARLDGKGADISNSGNPKAKQLRTNEIRLFKNEDLSFLNATYAFNTSKSGSHSDVNHSYNSIYDMDDVYSSSALYTQIKRLAIKTIKFDYSYDLCKGTPNSDDLAQGKLTLNKITILGKNENVIFPPYVFDYSKDDANKNPNYGVDKYDRWGYYKHDFVAGPTSNRFVTDDVYSGTTLVSLGSKNYVDAWSLRKVITPTGGEMEFKYESDSYSRNGSSEFGNYCHDATGPVDFLINTSYKYQTCYLNTNVLDIYSGQLLFELYYNWQHGLPVKIKTYNDNSCIVDYVSGCPSGVDIDAFEFQYVNILNVDMTNSKATIDVSGISGFVECVSGYIPGKKPALRIILDQLHFKYPNIVYGGGVRVKEIDIVDESSNSYKQFFDYSENSVFSSGFTEAEPPHYDKSAPVFGRYQSDPTSQTYGAGSPGVMYSRVKVKTATAENINAIKTIEYNFEAYDPEKHFKRIINHPKSYSKQVITMNKLGQVGRLNEIKIYDQNNLLLQSKKLIYADNIAGRQGIVRDAVNSVRNVWHWSFLPGATYAAPIYRGWFLTTNETTYFPNILVEEINTGKTVSSKATNLAFDFFTGNVLQSENENAFGEKDRTKTVLAYYKYPSLGSKCDNLSNKNMLTESAQSYSYNVDPIGTEKLLASSVQTWNNNWNYREYNSSSDQYVNIGSTDVWRKYQTLIWKSLNNMDGTPSTFVDYVWSSSSQDPGWQRTTEITQYNHNSQIQEMKDINGNYTSTKMGYSDVLPILSAANGRYSSVAYSGAEDLASGSYFGGEVKGSSKRYPTTASSTVYAHTGSHCVKQGIGEDGFSYSGTVGSLATNDFHKGQKIRATVWIYNNSAATGGLLIANLYNSSTSVSSYSVDISNATTKFAGSFALLTLDFEIPIGTVANRLEIKTSNSSTPIGTGLVYFDDFRVQPFDATIVSSVYDGSTGWVKAILDINNFGSKYDYDNGGRLIRVSKETVLGWQKVTENTYHYGRP